MLKVQNNNTIYTIVPLETDDVYIDYSEILLDLGTLPNTYQAEMFKSIKIAHAYGIYTNNTKTGFIYLLPIEESYFATSVYAKRTDNLGKLILLSWVRDKYNSVHFSSIYNNIKEIKSMANSYDLRKDKKYFRLRKDLPSLQKIVDTFNLEVLDG